MITAKLKTGRRWDLERGDRLVVNGEAFDLGAISELVVEQPETVRGMDITIQGRALRGVVQVDGPSGIAVVSLWPYEQAREIGRNLAAGAVAPASADEIRRLGG